MKLIFFGSSSFSVPALKSLGSSISLVVTRKTKPKGRGYLLEDNEVKRAALSLGLPLVEIDSFKDEAAKMVADGRPDLLVVASFGLIIPRWFLSAASIGSINVHPSLLPKYRGPSPIQWVLWNGETETGITIIKMSERMDAGDILYQEKVSIDREDDAATLSHRLSTRVSEILPGIVDDVTINGIEHGIPQNEEDATYTPMITKEMGRIEWGRGSAEIVGQVRALVMWPTAYTHLDDKMLKVFKATRDAYRPSDLEPGTVFDIPPEGIQVGAGEGSVVLKEVQIENRKRMAARDFARGYRDLLKKRLS